LAAAGLWRAGSAAEALTTWELAFNAAQAAGLRRTEFAIATMLAGLHNDIADENKSEEWACKARLIAEQIPRLGNSFAAIATNAELATSRNDLDALRRLLTMAYDHLPQSSDGTQSRLARAIEINVARLSGQRVELEEAIRDLTMHHMMGSETGNISDFEIASAALLLDGLGHTARAYDLVTRYLSEYRRGRSPVAGMLRVVLSRRATDRASSRRTVVHA